MEVWLKSEDEELQLPVLPSSFEMGTAQQNQVVNINAIGEVLLAGLKGLKSITISSIFPAQRYEFCKCEPKEDPYDYCKMIENWKDKKQTVQLIITETIINMDCKIESFSYGESDGSGDVSYNIDLKQYIKLKKRTAEVKKEVASKTVKAVTTKRKQKTKTKTYTVKNGDTLCKIAKSTTGSSSNWKAIYEKNKSTIGSNPNRIKIGMKLVIPS